MNMLILIQLLLMGGILLVTLFVIILTIVTDLPLKFLITGKTDLTKPYHIPWWHPMQKQLPKDYVGWKLQQDATRPDFGRVIRESDGAVGPWFDGSNRTTIPYNAIPE